MLRFGGSETPLYRPGIYLGFIEEATFENARTTLGPDQTIVVYSDGAIEEENATGERFGEGRLAQIVRTRLAAEEPLAAILDAARAEILDFCKHKPATDDITVIAIRTRSAP